jgi:hypothetical protein
MAWQVDIEKGCIRFAATINNAGKWATYLVGGNLEINVLR